MSYRGRAGSPALPWTFAGRWLRAAMLDHREERDRLVRTLNGGSATGWNDDEPAVVNATMDLLFRRYFSPDRMIHDKVERLIEVVNQALVSVDRGDDSPKAEALISAALDAHDHGADQLPARDRYQLSALVVLTASGILELDEADVNGVLREAERLAFEQGFHPPLVPRDAARRPGRLNRETP